MKSPGREKKARPVKKPTSPLRTNISINLSLEKARRFHQATEKMGLRPSMVLRAFIEMVVAKDERILPFIEELEEKPVKYFRYG